MFTPVPPCLPSHPLCRAHNSRETIPRRTLENRRNNRRRSERTVYKVATYLTRIVAGPDCLSRYLFSFSGAVSDNLCHRPLNVTYRRRLVYILNSTCSSWQTSRLPSYVRNHVTSPQTYLCFIVRSYTVYITIIMFICDHFVYCIYLHSV